MATQQEALYDSLINDLLTLTKRNDEQETLEVHLRSSTTAAHCLAFFPRDLETAVVKLPNASALTALNVPTLFPRLRSFERVRVLDANYNPLDLPKIDVIEVGEEYDVNYPSYLKDNVAYQAGSSFNIRCLGNSYGFLVQYYSLPFVTRSQYNSWIAQLMPDVIIQMTLQKFYNDIGKEEDAARKSRLLDDGRGNGLVWDLKRNFLLGQAR